MPSIARPVLAIAFLASLAGVAAPPPVGTPMTVVVHPGPGAGGSDGLPRTYPVVSGDDGAVLDRELGNAVEGALVEVLGGSSGTPLRVQVQYETSVRIMNSRPRLDLLDWNHVTAPWLGPKEPQLDLRDWKHFTSPWLDLERDAEGRFRVVTLGTEERTRFPRVDPTELADAVRAAGGRAWDEVAERVSDPRNPPAIVGVSAIRLRVVYGEPEATFVVEYPIAAGC